MMPVAHTAAVPSHSLSPSSLSQVEQIDEEVKKLEYRLHHSSLSLQEEKKLLQQIKDLGKTREFVRDYNERMDKISADESSRGGLLQIIKEKDDQIAALRKQEAEQRAAIEAVRTKARAQGSEVPALLEEKNRLFEENRGGKEQIWKARQEFKAREAEWWEAEKEWRAQQAEDRKKAWEEREKRRQEYEERKKEREKEFFVEKYTDEIIMCDQVVAFLEKFTEPAPGSKKDGEEGKKGSSSLEGIQAPAGFGTMLVSKKNKKDEDLDSFFAGSGGGKKGKKKGGERPRSEWLTLPLDALASFGKLKITAPTTVSEAATAIEQVKEKKEEFVRLQAEAKAKREKEEEEKEKSAKEKAEKKGEEEKKEEVKEEAVDEKDGEADAEAEKEEEKVEAQDGEETSGGVAAGEGEESTVA